MTTSNELQSKLKLKIVFDTNVYIAALLRPGLSEELVRRGLRGDFEVMICIEIIQELKQKLDSKFDFPSNRISEYIAIINEKTKLVKIKNELNIIKLDKDDNKIIECAIAEKADLIISLDKHLLHLKKYKNIAILHPKTFSWIIPETK